MRTTRPGYLYRGQVLYEVKRDYPGAIKAWERFLALVPQGKITSAWPRW